MRSMLTGFFGIPIVLGLFQYNWNGICASLGFENAKTWQDVAPVHPGLLDDKLLNYYQHVNLAARAIYRNDFEAASCQFDTAFTFRQVPEYCDVKRFILVNSKCGLYAKDNRFIPVLLNNFRIDTAVLFKNIPRRVFNAGNLALINSLQNRKNSVKKSDNRLEKALREIHTLDEKTHDVKAEYGAGMSWKAYHRMADSIDNDNARRFLRLSELEGFPSEESVGVYYDEEQEWCSVIYFLLMRFLRTDAQPEILDWMEQAFQLGKINPSNYASLLDYVNQNSADCWKKEYNFMNTTLCIVQGKFYRPFVYYSDSLMREVNSNRIAIGLDSFHITQKQVVCIQLCHKEPGMPAIEMAPYPRIDELPYGFVKYAADKENQGLSKYLINTKKILAECQCEEKYY